ncbi:E3 ubiquitin-protein ligase rnf213-alpha [Sardina pilchardus]|uniref:E3 ubiquitin-protein ligase rnf213-alpha n=1 Tax=Sardina pilchardus TaxID=27697 RepID=UPI002E14E720
MKCVCGHIPPELNARFCSQCGTRFTAQESQDTADAAEKNTTQSDDPSSLDSQSIPLSPKRPLEETSNSPKKKKKARKRRKKKSDKKDGLESLTSDLSDTSLTERDLRQERGSGDAGSDSESSASAMDEMPDPAASPADANPALSPVAEMSDISEPSDTQTANASPAKSPPDRKIGEVTSDQDPTDPTEMSDISEPSDTQTANASPAKSPPDRKIGEVTSDQYPTDTDTHVVQSKEEELEKEQTDQSLEGEASPSVGDNLVSTDDPNAQPISGPAGSESQSTAADQTNTQQAKSSGKDKQGSKKKKKDTSIASNPPASEDHNANTDKNANLKQAPVERTKTNQQNTGKVFGPQNTSQSKSVGTSVDVKVEKNEVQQASAQSSGDAPSEQSQKKDTSENKDTPKAQKSAPPPDRISTRSQQITASDKLTIYFHAVLSKDFKLIPQEDRIFIRAGRKIGNWESNIVELTVCRDLGEHGYLIAGELLTSKTKAASESIPYKYLVYRQKKGTYEYEHIYKLDAQKMTNRCLFVKPHLLNEEGEWHQYDDIICAEPSKNVLKRLTQAIWPDQRKSLIEGREIAGGVMLETIFDLLSSWSEINLKSFMTQLRQFYQIYGNPFIYEERQEKWYSLRYDEDDVSKLLKEFMLNYVTPELRKDGEGTKAFIKDSLNAAVIMLYVWKNFKLPLDSGELSRLCVALCLPNLAKDQFLTYWQDFQLSFSCLKGLPDLLMTLMTTVRTRDMHHWVLVLPILHLQRGMCKPFEAVPLTSNPKYEPSWAGIQGLKVANATFSSQERSFILKLMKNNPYLVKIDHLLSRSVMCLLTLEDLIECSSVLGAELIDLLHVFHMKVPSEISFSNSTSITDTLTHIQSRLIEHKFSCFSEVYGTECLATSVKVLEKVCKGLRYTYNQSFVDIPVACMNLVGAVSDFTLSQESDKKNTLSTRSLELLSDAMQVLRSWIAQTFKQKLLRSFASVTSTTISSEIEIWNNIISLSFEDEEFTTTWRRMFTRDFEGKFRQEDPLDQVDVYCSKMEKLSDSHPHIAKSVEKCALDAVTALCQVKSEDAVFKRVTNITWNWKFGKLVSTMIQQSWPKVKSRNDQDDQEVVIRHVLDWKAAKNVFQLHGTEQKLIDQLTDDAKEKITVAISAFSAVTDQLIRGDIQMKLLSYILEKRANFMELLKTECLCGDGRFKDDSAMRRLLLQRQKEVTAVYHEKKLVDGLLIMCQKLQEHLKVDVEELDQSNQIDVEIMNLNNFMEVHAFGQLSAPMAGVVTFFDLNDDVRNMAEVLHTFRDSYIFKLCWDWQAREYVRMDNDESDLEESDLETDIVVTPEMIHDEIFQPCYSRYQQIYAQLKNGSLRLEQVDVVFKDYRGRYEDLAADLDIMCWIDAADDKRWIERKVQQIEQYHELHLAVESAKVVQMVKETLCLQGDFVVLDLLLTVANEDFKKECLDRIDNEMMQAKTVMVDITETRRLCLQELGMRKNFVMWVKEALEDINELKVFVDLASISAGENDLDVDRVACFHDAVLGYAPMLYELKPSSGFTVFKEVLKKLWKALDNDPNLPKKLRDTARHLEWLKTVKDSHGSVELSSLSLASAVNEKGIYVITAEGQKKLSLDTVVKLQIPEEHEDGQELRHYSLEDLRDLQNKLMLMSGKGDQGQSEVDLFAEVFASVQRLAVAFIDLYAAGNPLFRQWQATINCKAEQAGVIMDFGLGSAVSMIIVKGNPVEQLPELCKRMETCLSFWKDFMDKQRSQYYYLNYFTAEQIVYLCSKLTQTSITRPDQQTLMMLSFIRSDCNLSNLREAWHSLQYHILTESPEKNNDIEFQTFIEVPSTQYIGTSLEDESDSNLESVFRKMENVEGPGQLDLIWNAYMRDMNAFLQDSLDVGRLGKLLEILANQADEDSGDEDIMICETKKGAVQRELPQGLVAGRPNLIVCPAAEILTSCISIYMASGSEALPTYDEVLLCNPETPYEQVELFLRRCLMAKYDFGTRKIYTMLYVDQLPYEVSYKVEQFFHKQKMQSSNDYRLVLICSADREHTYIPSAFSQYRLHMVPLEPLGDIQEYLTSHYRVPSDQSSAAAVFKKGLCVGLVTSKRAGVGKSLYIQRMYEKLKRITKKPSQLKCIRLIEPRVDENIILHSLLESMERKDLTIFHFDVTTSVQKGLHEFLFKLLVLQYLMDSEGRMWKCSNNHLYIIELLQSDGNLRNGPTTIIDNSIAFLDVFPIIYCRPPKEVLEQEMRIAEGFPPADPEDPLMDDQEFRSEGFQRPYQYLMRFHNGANLDEFTYKGVEGTHVECLQMMFVYCGIMDPSWAELRNFTWFLNLQLRDCETSVFCDASFTGDTLQGFKTFVVDFMIIMAKDFATPSLSISDQSPGRLAMDLTELNEADLAPFRIRKRWESEPHPYIFFNDDHISMTFIGFHLQPNAQNGVDAIDPSTQRVIKRNIMTRELFEGLKLNRVPFNMDFDQLPRGEKIERLCNVLGIQWPLDPDETYELTTDNILKMLAIHMRFRCGIPVIIMGETGCGKTRLIKFLCELRRSGVNTENMTLVKVHGGTSSDMIYQKVREAEAIACTNKENYGFDSVLFFDEANTTEAISSIKEVLCDNTALGEKLNPNTGLQVIAACNPYRKHTDVMIQRLESAGLGYRVRADETEEKLGTIPLRQLVYRVQALPPSMIPLVWDFGQLNDQTEKMYIQQIVQRVVEKHCIDVRYTSTITDVMASSQKYMRTRMDECSFVSLRDVERCMQTFVWFYENHPMLLDELEKYQRTRRPGQNERAQRFDNDRNPVLWSLLMAIGVCYHACLEDKEKYRIRVSRYFKEVNLTPVKMKEEISLMQDLMLSGVPLGDTIARNNALKENVFMMVICIELRIPLFLVGKPGSSKSLSKTLVADAMQGQAAHSDMYRKLKQIHLVSFQCSPHSTPDGIINTFKQCARFQEGKNLKEYISVVVLDEIGLAEDSPKMPLKTLHPLLEEGCIDDQPLPHKKVGFIGISNWALDPAKMNRGIFVSRGDPDETELIESAKGICSSDRMVLEMVRDFFKPFARAYLNVCKRQGKGFFGLRDYYSLVKMVFAMAKTSNQKPGAEQIVEAVLRNFSGKDGVNPVKVFTERLQIKPNLESINAIELVRQNITAIGQDEECRYLLVLTKNYAALQILQQTFFTQQTQPEIIFGSSFPKDQEYTQICRNINRVKICMETGQTIVLLNLQNLYESLYDALNQYYVCLGGQKYVDLGLGTHRVKCRVHKDFRLIVIEEKEIVYKQFPIPLINRLEKHYLDINTVLGSEQKVIVKELEKWVKAFVSPDNSQSLTIQVHKYQLPDAFIGYHSDTCASVILQITEKLKDNMTTPDYQKRVLEEAKLVLLNCTTPDAVVRLDCTNLSRVESQDLERLYFEEQKHSCLTDFIFDQIQQRDRISTCFTEVTTFSRLLTASDLGQLQEAVRCIELLSLQQFDTEYSFLKKIRTFLDTARGSKILIIQTDFDEATHSSNLIASAKYSAINEINKTKQEVEETVFVYFITKLPRVEGGTSYVGFHGGQWRSVHIDDLRKSKDMVSDIKALRNLTISQLFEEKEKEKDKDPDEAMEVEDMYSETNSETNPEPMEQEEAEPGGWENILDTTALVRSCVQSAVGMLRDEADVRSTRRVELLLMLMSESEELRAMFLRTMKRRLHLLLQARDEGSHSAKSWVFKEAANIDALQEGGTFRHTLWKRVQAVVIPFLAQLISVIDRDSNLDLLLDPDASDALKALWLDIFGNDKLLEVPYTRVDSSEAKTILVPSSIRAAGAQGCSMPFSWRIRDYLEELWVHALQREGHTQKQFEEFYWKTPLGRQIAQSDAEMQVEFLQRYLQDFIAMTINVTSKEELQLLCAALMCCVNELRASESEEFEESEVLALPWIHSAYHQYCTRLQNLSRMLCIEPHITQALLRNAHAQQGQELVLDVYAALACVEFLEPQTLGSEAQCAQWLRRVKQLQVPVELVCAEENVQHYRERSKAMVTRVQRGWSRIFSLSLFVENMLLGIQSVDQNLAPLLVEGTKKLGQVLEKNPDLKQQQPFEAVLVILKECKDGAVERIFRFGVQLCPVCMADPKDPLALPCDHIYCMACIRQWLIPGQMYCPLCMNQVPDDFRLQPSEEIRALITCNAQFRQRCNGFFIALVSSVCFGHDTPPSQEVILHLLSFLMVEAGTLQAVGRKQPILTKALSPFDESVDQNPVVRSVVLKLLLKYSFDDVKMYLQQHLSAVESSRILEETDKSELYSLYINCLEDSMFDRMQWRSEKEQQVGLQEESVFLRDFLQSRPASASASAQTVCIELLQQLSRLRLCLDIAAQLIGDRYTAAAGRPAQPPAVVVSFLAAVRNVCVLSKNDWYRVYLIRKIRSRHGVEFVQMLLNVNELHWMFPEEVLQQTQEGGQMDLFLVCEGDYKSIRDAIAKAMMEGRVERIQEACDGCRNPPLKRSVFLLLALFREVTCLYRANNANQHPTQKQLQALEDFVAQCGLLASPEQKAFAVGLLKNQLGALSVRAGSSGAEHMVSELCVHLAAVLLCGHHGVLSPLKQLALTPNDMQAAFIPTMPDDMLHVAQQALGQLQWYFCPNGHPCTVGECGQPMQVSRCPDCNANIGGQNHLPVPGFTATVPQGDRTRAGHILGDPGRRDQPDMQDTKNMSPAPFTLVRLLTHATMMLGATNNTQALAALISPAVPDCSAFVRAHLQMDLLQLTRALGKGADDTITCAHLIVNALLEPPPAAWPANYDPRLSTKEARNEWETAVANNIISPQLKHLDRRLQEVGVLLREDERVSCNPVMRVTFGDPRLFLRALPRDSGVHGPAVWSCRERLSLATLAHIVEQQDGRDTLPLLWRFLQREPELRLVRFLPDILVLQRDLVKKFQNSPDLTVGTISKFLQDQRRAAWYEKRISIFLKTWNQLRLSLATNGEIQLPPNFCEKDLDMNSDLQVLLPRRQGLGLCSTALVSYLIALHNEMVYTTDKYTGEETSYTVSPADLCELHVIRFDVERDVLPLVVSHCQYSVERGGGTLPDYDLPKIQQQLLTRFLQGKPRITLNGIPTLVNRHDRNYENIFRDVKGKVVQEPLPTLTLTWVAGELCGFSEVCDALGAVELALGFLATTAADPHMQLGQYLQDVLQMGDHMPPHILKALSRCSLKHAVALWQLLSSLKSESMLRLKRDPFVGVSDDYKLPLDEEGRKQLIGYLSKGGASGFLLEMHEFLQLQLKGLRDPELFRPDWGLKDTLVSYIERKDMDAPPEVEQFFPEGILLSQCVDTWKICVEFQQERSHR